jgi:ATP-binding cassette subfamily F protein 3
MVSLKDIYLSFGANEIFQGISFDIHEKDKIGLVGRNGVGKSSLLKILVGELKPDSGQIAKMRELTIGYLPQHLPVVDTTTVLNEAMKAFDHVLKLERQLDDLTAQLKLRTDYESKEYLALVDRVEHLTHQLAALNADTIEQQAIKTLLGLGFTQEDLQRPTSEFSGGWRMRIEIAKLLLQKPKLLLLDEPTNHLDIESIIWLEQFLKQYKGAIVLISHDRRFLDSVTNRTIEIVRGKIYDYPVSYSKFVELRKQRIEYQRSQYENQLKKIRQTEQFIQRFRYNAHKASQVQSRLKQLEKTELVEIDEIDTDSINFRFLPAPRSGDIVVELKNVSKSFDSKQVLQNIDLTVTRGEKIAFVGKNGEGKTTLVRIIIGELDCQGQRKIGHNVQIGYYAQNQEHLLDKKLTVYQTIEKAAPFGYSQSQLRGILANFLFTGDDLDKKVEILSGGEKARLALATMVLKPYNLLILDEPTNHLDIYAKQVLKKALNQFDGTLIIVSHDREFLSGLVNTVYEVKNHRIKQYKGGIDFFLSQKKLSDFYDFEKTLTNASSESKQQKSKEQKLSENKQLYLRRKELQRKINSLQKKISGLENQIEILEEKIRNIERQFANPNNVTEKHYQEYSSLKQQVSALMSEWERLNEQLEEKQKELELL